MPTKRSSQTCGWPLSDELSARVLSIVAEGLFEKATYAARMAALEMQEDSLAFAKQDLLFPVWADYAVVPQN